VIPEALDLKLLKVSYGKEESRDTVKREPWVGEW
jgi:hypothetical protein